MLSAVLHSDRSRPWIDRDGETQDDLVAHARRVAALLRPDGRRVVLSCRHARSFVPGLLGAWLAGRCLTRNHFTRDDSLLSVRRAWTLTEVEGLLRRAGLEPVDRRTTALGQRYAVVAVPAASAAPEAANP